MDDELRGYLKAIIVLSSLVVGFLAALVFAPVLEELSPAKLLVRLLLVTVGALLSGIAVGVLAILSS